MEARTVGKYELVHLISKGGMGELYRARQQGPGDYGREVALKIIRSDLEPDAKRYLADLFTEEARILSLFHHANLVHIHELGLDGETLFIAMELVEGHDLRAIRNKPERPNGALPVPLVLYVVEQVTRGLDYAHRLVVDGQRGGFVHRDVSPSNILVSFDGAVKLTDFGVARIKRSQPLTQGRLLKGKLSYMAPEYLTLGAGDRRSDVWSLGVVLWEALAGAPLFGQFGEAERTGAILAAPIRPPSKPNALVPKELDAIVLRALERDPEKRFQSARELGTALRELAAAQDLAADDVDLGKELRRRYPLEVPATAMDLDGLTRKRSLSIPPKPAPPVSPPVSDVEAPTLPNPVVEAPSSAEVSTESMRPRPAEPQTPTAPVAPTIPDRPRLEDPPPARPGARRWLPAAVALAVALLAGGLFWWQQRPAERPVAEPSSPLPAPKTWVSGKLLRPAEAAQPASPPPGERAQVVANTRTPTPAPTQTPTPPTAPTPSAHPEPPPSRPERSRGAKPRHAPRPGTLAVIAVHPWVQVFVDGVSRGYSPAPALSVPTGRHKITLSNEELGLSKSFNVTIPETGRVVFRGEFDALKPATEKPTPEEASP